MCSNFCSKLQRFNHQQSVVKNNADSGYGVICLNKSDMSIESSKFMYNTAIEGGVLYVHNSTLDVHHSTYSYNRAIQAGVIASKHSSVTITNSKFNDNAAQHTGGVIHTYKHLYSIYSSTFTNNIAAAAAGVMHTTESILSISSSTFRNNSVTFDILMVLFESALSFANNGRSFGGVMQSSKTLFNITDSTFTDSSATSGGVIHANETSLNIANCNFTNNKAAVGGVMYTFDRSSLIVAGSILSHNTVDFGGVLITIGGSLNITNSIFNHNFGSLYTYSSNITFSGYMKFINCTEPPNKTNDVITHQEGGAITSYQSVLFFTGETSMLNNQANNGGAILATESTIVMYNKTIVANNRATNSDGGGIYLHQTNFEIKGNGTISQNHATRGGGIHASSSSIIVHQQGALQLLNNSAEKGGGTYFKVNTRLNLLKSVPSFSEKLEKLLMFIGNYAKYGGAMYVADDTNSAACTSTVVECFIQTLEIHRVLSEDLSIVNMIFNKNIASKYGSNLFGGLLHRCIPSPFAEIYLKQMVQYNGVTYIENITNITLDSIASLPVQICFCNNEGQPDCNYQPPIIKVEKGKTFTVSLVAVDQVNHTVNGDIISFLTSTNGNFGGGQQTQKVSRNCTDLIFNVFSPQDAERIMLYVDGPCGSSSSSIQNVNIQFLNCTCPVGFEPSDSVSSCECECHSVLSPYITKCDYATSSLVRVGTNLWITYINDTLVPGYVLHPYCPIDYCYLSTENVSINLNLPNGADMQCDHNRRGKLCGACQKHYSLSLGSSHCLPCHSHWPVVFVTIFLAAIVAGILLVVLLLALNMTVAIGLINSFIFYANIVSAGSSVFFPSSEPSFATVFVAWLNLDIGIDVCFFDGLDTYGKTWLQLAFPTYIISLVVLVIIVSEYSPRFARLIGKKDPIATLATLILLSYAKLLSITIAVLSFVVLHYPDGSRETLWFIDGNIKYFQGKHIALVLMVISIIIVGIPFTIVLFIWQWLVQIPEWKVFKWTRNTKLNAFISAYHAPYNSKHRYWAGLLLLVRVIVYITVAVTVSIDPQIPLIMIISVV